MPFSRSDVLRPDVLGFFLGRMRALDRAPESPAVAAAIENASLGRFDSVMGGLSGADSEQLSVRFLMGLALFSKGDLNAAAEQFRASLRISSEFLPAAFYVGACYAAGGKDEQAVGAWQTSLVTESDLRIIYELIADAQMRLLDSTAAIDILSEARERWPDDDRLLPRLGAALATAGRRNAALETLVPYLDRHHDAPEALFLAMRLIYDAHAEGTTILGTSEDRQLMTRYAGLYKAAGGPSSTLVDRWVQFVR